MRICKSRRSTHSIMANQGFGPVIIVQEATNKKTESPVYFEHKASDMVKEHQDKKSIKSGVA